MNNHLNFYVELFSKIFFIYTSLKEIQSRKERSNMLFDTSQYLSSSALMAEDNDFDEENFVCTNLNFFKLYFSQQLKKTHFILIIFN